MIIKRFGCKFCEVKQRMGGIGGATTLDPPSNCEGARWSPLLRPLWSVSVGQISDLSHVNGRTLCGPLLVSSVGDAGCSERAPNVPEC